jgi:hypothetical protein
MLMLGSTMPQYMQPLLSKRRTYDSVDLENTGSTELKIGLIVWGLAPNSGATNARGGSDETNETSETNFCLQKFHSKTRDGLKPAAHHSSARGLHQSTNGCCRGI